MSFSEGQKVRTKHGIGKVVYAEDDCIDVLIKGREYNYLAPFEGKVEDYVEVSDDDKIFDAITKHHSGSALMTQVNKMMLIGAVVQKMKAGTLTKVDAITILNAPEHVLKPLVADVNNAANKDETIRMLCECSQYNKDWWLSILKWDEQDDANHLGNWIKIAIERVKMRFDQFKNLDHFGDRGEHIDF